MSWFSISLNVKIIWHPKYLWVIRKAALLRSKSNTVHFHNFKNSVKTETIGQNYQKISSFWVQCNWH